MVGARSSKSASAAEISQMLREAREAKGLTVEDASRELNIAVTQLYALEEGDFSMFAAEVYARGAFIKYAQFLGVDSEPARRAFLRALSSVREIVPLRLHTPERWYQRLVNPRSILFAAATFVACCVGGYIIWQVRSFWQLPALEVSGLDQGIINEASVTIEGVAEASARVRINDEPILLQEDATFVTEIGLRQGINVIRIEAENVAGRVKVIERHILRPREGVGANLDNGGTLSMYPHSF